MQGRDRSRRRAQTTSTLSEKARTKGYALRSSSSVLADGLPAPTRKCADVRYGSKADMDPRPVDVRFVPKADMAAVIVSAIKQLPRHDETKGFGSVEI